MFQARSLSWAFVCFALLLWSVTGCQCGASECQFPADCPWPQACQQGQCTNVQKEAVTESKPEKQTEVTTTEPVQDTTEPTSNDASTETTPEVSVEEPAVTPEPNVETTPEVSVEEPTVEVGADKAPDSPDTSVTPESSGKSCKQPSDCTQGEYCLQNVCQSKPECNLDSDCTVAPMTTCLGGYCTVQQPACKSTGQCVLGTVCHDGNCVPGPLPSTCKATHECPGNFVCRNGSCSIRGGNPPNVCTSNANCPTGLKCSFGYCVRTCTSSSQCTSTSVPYCQAGQCHNPNLPPGVCNSDSDCMPRQFCSSSQCITCKAPPDCKADSDCKTGQVCRNGQCGVTCFNDAECKGGFTICSQGFCRGDGHKPVGCPENQEICDLVIDQIKCLGNKRMEVSVKNIGIGPAVGRFYLCYEAKGSTKGCNGAIIMNYFNGGGVLRPQGIAKVTVSWAVKTGDTISVDRPDLILEANDTNNTRQIQAPCP